jgi:enoyl-CoA hydratase
MKYSTLELSIDESVAHLRLIRPASYNSMNRAFWREFPRALVAVGKAEDVRALVISSTGKHFSAGMDLDVFAESSTEWFQGEAARRAEFVRRMVLELQAIFTQLESLRMPVLAAVQGACIGGALDLICACDSRYCTSDAFFSVKETALGMVADLGTLQRLPTLISPGLARELVYTARDMKAVEALSSGLVNQVFDDSTTLLTKVLEIAQQIAQFSPVAVSGSKAMLNYSRDHSVSDSLNYMATWQGGMFQSVDIMESIVAKQKKRKAVFDALRTIEPIMTEKNKP